MPASLRGHGWRVRMVCRPCREPLVHSSVHGTRSMWWPQALRCLRQGVHSSMVQPGAPSHGRCAAEAMDRSDQQYHVGLPYRRVSSWDANTLALHALLDSLAVPGLILHCCAGCGAVPGVSRGLVVLRRRLGREMVKGNRGGPPRPRRQAAAAEGRQHDRDLVRAAAAAAHRLPEAPRWSRRGAEGRSAEARPRRDGGWGRGGQRCARDSDGQRPRTHACTAEVGVTCK